MESCKRHMERVIYDGNGKPTACRWCARCGAIYHPKRKKDRTFTKKLYWQFPQSVKILEPQIKFFAPPSPISDD